MSGGLLQLVARGAQDAHFVNNPEMSFFRATFRRHSNYAIESIRVPFIGRTEFGRRITTTIPKSGDLVHKMYIRMTLPEVNITQGYAFRWLDYVGLLICSAIELEVGGVRVDRHTGEWLYLWNQLTRPAGHFLGYSNLVGHNPRLTTPTYALTGPVTIPAETLYIPLEFWFNRDVSHALPLIAMQHHDVRIHVDLRALEECVWTASQPGASSLWEYDADALSVGEVVVSSKGLMDVDLFVDYVFLDTAERQAIANAEAMDYVVTQLQINEFEASNRQQKLELDLNHPCKELVWVSQKHAFTQEVVSEAMRPGGRQWFNFSDGYAQTYAELYRKASLLAEPFGGLTTKGESPGLPPGGNDYATVKVSSESGKNPFERATLMLNGTERQSERDGKYYNVLQPMQYHTNVPPTGINVMCFALNPESPQPSGALNMSRIDMAALNVTLSQDAMPAMVRVYASNMNVLHISKGLAGMLYAN